VETPVALPGFNGPIAWGRAGNKTLLTSNFHCVRKITFYPHLKSLKIKFALSFDEI
jgi:hypothetical protein